MAVQDVNAPVRGVGVSDQAFQGVVVGHVGWPSLSAATRLGNVLHRFLGAFWRDVGNDDKGALSGHDFGTAAADAGTGAGNDRHTILEYHSFVSSRLATDGLAAARHFGIARAEQELCSNQQCQRHAQHHGSNGIDLGRDAAPNG